MLANAVLLIHFILVLFITAGLPMIYLGAALGWSWVPAWQLRARHLAAILVRVGKNNNVRSALINPSGACHHQPRRCTFRCAHCGIPPATRDRHAVTHKNPILGSILGSSPGRDDALRPAPFLDRLAYA